MFQIEITARNDTAEFSVWSPSDESNEFDTHENIWNSRDWQSTEHQQLGV